MIFEQIISEVTVDKPKHSNIISNVYDDNEQFENLKEVANQ